MDSRLVECVPNFSEGRDQGIINSIAGAIGGVSGVTVLNTDSGEAANRTVITFAGSPKAVCEAAFRGVEKAAELIDMRKQSGTHPRIGATDVLPIIPVAGITLEECAELARKLAARIAAESGIPCYCYEASAFSPERRKLEDCRAGEYEGLSQRLGVHGKGADYGDRPFDERAARTGATVIGARNYLIAVNFNLNTKDRNIAEEIAKDVRERGRVLTSPDGKRIRKPGTLKGVKAIGWYIEEYGIAQVSMNITDINTTPLHIAHMEVCRAAEARGVRVTGTEIIGLVPERCLLDAGEYLAEMNLSDLRPFDPDKKVLERVIKKMDQDRSLDPHYLYRL